MAYYNFDEKDDFLNSTGGRAYNIQRFDKCLTDKEVAELSLKKRDRIEERIGVQVDRLSKEYREREQHIAALEKELLELRRQLKQTKTGYTVVLYMIGDRLGFLKLEGNHSNLNNVWLNDPTRPLTHVAAEVRKAKQKSLVALLYDEYFDFKEDLAIDLNEFLDYVRSGANVIKCGYLPKDDAE